MEAAWVLLWWILASLGLCYIGITQWHWHPLWIVFLPPVALGFGIAWVAFRSQEPPSDT